MTIDIQNAREFVVNRALDTANDDREGIIDRLENAATLLGQALNELEALRKPERPDVKAWREELARIDARWDNAAGPRSAENAYRAARALLIDALAAIDAGWPEPSGDVVERAAQAASVADGNEAKDWTSGADTERYRDIARSVLHSAGRLPDPVAITPEIVEEAAKRAWVEGGPARLIREWGADSSCANGVQDMYRRIGRAVLEYAASLGGVAPAPVVGASRRYALPIGETRPILCNAHGMTEEQVIHRLVGALDTLAADLQRCVVESHARPPAGKCAANRLTAYRCAIMQGYAANFFEMRREWGGVPDDRDLEKWLAAKAEHLAHCMLAAEKEPTRG